MVATLRVGDRYDDMASRRPFLPNGCSQLELRSKMGRPAHSRGRVLCIDSAKKRFSGTPLGKSVDDLLRCSTCGQYIDLRNLEEVLEHEMPHTKRIRH